MSSQRFLLCLAATALVLFALAIAAVPASVIPTEPTAPELTAFMKSSPCVTADTLRRDGLLTEAEDRYDALLNPSDQENAPLCAVTGLQDVAQQRETAAQLAAYGDRAASEGNPAAARVYYTDALHDDHGNQAALSGLQNLDQQRPNGIRQARDYWNQIVANTLVPLGQFFLWLLAAFAGLYILYLLTRVGARRLPLKAMPSWRRTIKLLAWLSFVLAAAAAGSTVYIGVSGQRHGWVVGGWWLALLVTTGMLVVIGCLLSAWCLRSGTGVQFDVMSEDGSADTTACAFLAGRLNSLGTKPPRGFDLPEGTDVTSLTGVLTLLPGGGMLSALANFLLARVQVTPWRAVVTLINQDQLLVTLHRNGRLVKTVLADRKSLFFPGPVSGQDSAGTPSYVQAIDRYDMLTASAAIILVSMALADKRSPLQTGLNGATSWESVAGQVLATEQGLSGNEGLSKALVERAIDVDPGNLAAQVARINIDGRRASDAVSRKDFAVRISALGSRRELTEPGYEALRLRVLYSSAAGWCNVFLDDQDPVTWHEACNWTNRFINDLYVTTGRRRLSVRSAVRPLQSLAVSMQPTAYILWAALGRFTLNLPSGGYISLRRFRAVVEEWNPAGMQTSGIAYAEACLAAGKGDYDTALRNLKQATDVDTGLCQWARRDPSFAELRAHCAKEFLAIVGDRPPESFTGVEPMVSHAAQLSDIGVHTAADLRDMTSTDAGQQLFAQAVGVPQLVIARWRNIAMLASIPNGPDTGQLDLLIAVGVDSLKALRAAVDEDISKLVKDLRAAAAYSPVEIRAEDLRRWAWPGCPGRPDQIAAGPP